MLRVKPLLEKRLSVNQLEKYKKHRKEQTSSYTSYVRLLLIKEMGHPPLTEVNVTNKRAKRAMGAKRAARREAASQRLKIAHNKS